MGVLDEAIRQHLELKRKHGAEEGEIARQEREALGAPQRESAPAPAEGAAEPSREFHAAEGPSSEPGGYAEAEHEAYPLEGSGDEPELGESYDATESLEAGEVPRLPGDDPVADDDVAPPAGHEPAEDSGDEPRPEPGADAEDVLEETPDFLQETPEHDRLWFEQKPPRDFDFDE